MSDIDMQIMLLFQQLDAEQKQDFICHALSMLEAEPEGVPSDQGSMPS